MFFISSAAMKNSKRQHQKTAQKFKKSSKSKKNDYNRKKLELTKNAGLKSIDTKAVFGKGLDYSFMM